MRIEIISASAGSGKTYKLSELLLNAVKEDNVRPDAILATTFTIKAAAELQERVRTRLLSGKLTTQAQQLSAARIGTVNSVCGGLLQDFAFYLGISPEQRVLEENAVAGVIAKAMAGEIDTKLSGEMYQLERRFKGLDIRKEVSAIIGKARANGLSGEDLFACGRRSVEEYQRLFGETHPNGAQLDQQLRDAIREFLRDVDIESDTTKTTKEARNTVQQLQRCMQQQVYLPWNEWHRLATLKTGKKSQEVADPLNAAAAVHDNHPRLKEDAQRLITLTFDIAARALTAYQEYKRRWGFIDFTDQEALALKLLQMQEPAEILSERLDLVLVDEFQDTSPIQLAIFLKLAALAKRSVWVGDQKQAIYGFRDADPSLMDAAIETILSGEEPETLSLSWRSRPELVRSTSDVFASAFAHQEFPEQRVRLEPAPEVEKQIPGGLGPAYECWNLESKNQSDDALALAGAMKAFLADENVRVRDAKTGMSRRVRGGDIAILCRVNDVCVAVAEALEKQGISAAVPRPGLLACPEVILVLAVMRLLIDPTDSLARAEVARLLDNPGDYNRWLQKALSARYAQAFDLAIFDEVEQIGFSLQAAGVLQVVDKAMQVADVRTHCCSWGNTEERLANLDSLRSLCAQYIESCNVASRGISPAGLLAHLEGLDADTKAVVQDEDTVQILTWHGAKGLEWPVTVLFQLEKVYNPLPLGVTVVSDTEFTLDDPLANRRLRFWPNPYGNFKIGAPFHDRLMRDDATLIHREKEQRQELRLLYVGWTRARDILVLVGRPGFLQKGILRLLIDDGDAPLLATPKDGAALWAGKEVAVTGRIGTPLPPLEQAVVPGSGYRAEEGREYPPAYQAASSVVAQGNIIAEERLGERLTLQGKPDMQMLGEAMHTFLGANHRQYAQEKRLQIAGETLERWGVKGNLSPEVLLQAGERLDNFIQKQWPQAVCHREIPVTYRTDVGTIISGFIDLLLETEEGYIIIDHKSFPGSIADAKEKAEGFAGQLVMYRDALFHAGRKKVLATYIHLPVVGLMVEVKGI
ncbi:UvrD-helicase domain-containing protein [uncultured Desulfobulbus sp.]|uniref:UvrD-helicase domain-containing protein n=1 Tax=uncultured Desulfobulbus sp. TaxID=239745 RepID=UPI0029C9197D|nr:UvrD-helicase domain-containing protein [uncultured Desulfobulbus sp.]